MTSPFAIARSVPEALALLDTAGPSALPVAGATWLMRKPVAGVQPSAPLVALQGIEALHRTERGEGETRIGALVTHDRLPGVTGPGAAFAALAEAARSSANPGVRRLATLGGNLCARDFAEADLPPALLALGAEIELQDAGGSGRLTLEKFLSRRPERERHAILTCVAIPHTMRRSAHARLTLRQAGDYPVAIVSVATGFDQAGRLDRPKIAVGSVEPVARRWHGLEDAVMGRPLDPAALREIAGDHLDAFEPREDGCVPGWYRRQVLPVLLERAFAGISRQQGA